MDINEINQVTVALGIDPSITQAIPEEEKRDIFFEVMQKEIEEKKGKIADLLKEGLAKMNRNALFLVVREGLTIQKEYEKRLQLIKAYYYIHKNDNKFKIKMTFQDGRPDLLIEIDSYDSNEEFKIFQNPVP